MAKHGKQYRALAANIDKTVKLPLQAALELVLKSGYAKFNESVDIAVRLNVNPRHADQMVRGAVVLPAGSGKETRVVVFAKGDKETEAREAGADFVGAEDLAEKILGGWTDFDKAIATPNMMGVVGRLGKVLGPRGLMPNPKVGTVTMDVATAVRESKAGKVEFRVDKAGVVHASVGRKSFTADQLRQNFLAVLESLIKAKPSTVKGVYIKSISLSTTMGPGMRVDPADVEAVFKK
ncbi:MAG TPA: 50S ribosomal protein L1 [Myxococcota bacterium]|nr:50S ribosomal protein L1 [Myxococcota bacterium]HNZ02771.1 50S ribosomal protein L1 [Myxococcota bacterium]HPB50805.1 50S ribosomal protein L1 [Myxococcota bacterium]HQP94624.1 50S ribosomal protein L1 [Myxococcota bacterium]